MIVPEVSELPVPHAFVGNCGGIMHVADINSHPSCDSFKSSSATRLSFNKKYQVNYENLLFCNLFQYFKLEFLRRKDRKGTNLPLLVFGVEGTTSELLSWQKLRRFLHILQDARLALHLCFEHWIPSWLRLQFPHPISSSQLGIWVDIGNPNNSTIINKLSCSVACKHVFVERSGLNGDTQNTKP